MAYPDDKRNAISYTYGDPNADAERARTFLDTINADERAHTYANGGPVSGNIFPEPGPYPYDYVTIGAYADAIRAGAHRLAVLYPDAFSKPCNDYGNAAANLRRTLGLDGSTDRTGSDGTD